MKASTNIRVKSLATILLAATGPLLLPANGPSHASPTRQQLDGIRGGACQELDYEMYENCDTTKPGGECEQSTWMGGVNPACDTPEVMDTQFTNFYWNTECMDFSPGYDSCVNNWTSLVGCERVVTCEQGDFDEEMGYTPCTSGARRWIGKFHKPKGLSGNVCVDPS